jgi:hypothetical protein
MSNAVFVHGLAALPSSDQSSKLFGEILPWLLVLIGVVIAGGVLIMFIRKRLQDDSSSSSPGFTLQDLRQLHSRGELTDEEYERAKIQMIGSVKAATKPKSALSLSKPQPEHEDDAYRAGKTEPSDQQSSP